MYEQLKKEFQAVLTGEKHTERGRDLWGLYVARMVNEDVARLLEEHVHQCTACRNQVNQLRHKYAEQLKLERSQRLRQRTMESLARAKQLSALTAITD